MKVTYIGDPLNKNDGPAVINHHGETFEKDKPKEVDDDHAYAEGFRTNPTFKVEGQKPPTRVTENPLPTPQDELIEWHEANGVKVDKRWGLAKLQESKAEAEDRAEKAAAEAKAKA